MYLSLIPLTIISLSGLLLMGLKEHRSKILNPLLALGTGSMLSVSLVHIFPEALEWSEYAVFAFIGGFLLIYLIEELLTPHRHDHGHGDHTHEDPHEHEEHIALVSWLAITLHTFLDGVMIRSAFTLGQDVGYMALLGVCLHQLPVALSLSAIFQKSAMRRKVQLILLTIFWLSASLWFLLTDLILWDTESHWHILLAALSGGSLLYVATADLLPMIHSESQKKKTPIFLFVLGVLVVSSIKLLES